MDAQLSDILAACRPEEQRTGTGAERNRGGETGKEFVMSVDLATLMKEEAGQSISLIAGSGGLSHEATWICHAGTGESAEQLKGGELAVVTGMGLPEDGDGKALLDHIIELRKCGACGVIIMLGPRISKVSRRIRDFCDEMTFPLFEGKENVDQEQFFKGICEVILRDSAKEQEISTAFKNAIFFPDQPERYVVPLSQYHFEAEDRYAICVLRMEHTSVDPYAAAEGIRKRLWNHLKREYEKCAVFTDGADIIAVISTEHSSEVRGLATDLLEYTRYLLPSDQNILYTGIGKLTRSLRCVYKSYRQALSIVKLQLRKSVPMTSIFYTDMGIYRLLLGIEDEEIKREYFQRVLGPLLEHDREKDADLSEVLRIYLKNNGSIAATAKELFVHRNTVTYKINQASKILNMDLGVLDNRIQVRLAFLLHEMF